MDDKVNQVPVQADSNPVTVQTGSKEGVPAVVESSVQNVENYIQPSEVEPQVSEEETKVGVEVVHSDPKLHPEAKSAGVKESIPSPNFSIPPTDPKIAEQTVKTSDVYTSDPWRALIALKEFAKGLFGIKKPQEVK